MNRSSRLGSHFWKKWVKTIALICANFKPALVILERKRRISRGDAAISKNKPKLQDCHANARNDEKRYEIATLTLAMTPPYKNHKITKTTEYVPDGFMF